MYSGNDEIDDEELEEAADLKSYEILDYAKIAGSIEKLGKLYEDKGFFLARITSKIEDIKKQPRDDVLSGIVNSSADGEQPMNVAECLTVLAQLLVAGNETTTATLAEGIYLLSQHPEQF